MFFVSLYHQSNRMTMFKKTDPNPQLDIFTAPSMQLGSRASKKYSDPNSWHNQFYSLVTTKIDEEIFKPLRDVPPYAIVGGVPARIIGSREKKQYDYGYNNCSIKYFA